MNNYILIRVKNGKIMERSQSFELRDKNHNDIQDIMENVLEKNLSLSTDSEKLGNSLLRINYFDSKIDKERQKSNRITILQEPEKRVYIQINGKLTDLQVSQLWNEFEKKLNISTYEPKIKEPESSKEEIIQEIKSLIKLKGYIIKDEDVQRFVDNFIEEYDRLPQKSEFHSIVKGYLIMVNQDYLLEKAEPSIKNESLLESNKPSLDTNGNITFLNSQHNNVLLHENSGGRRKCPNCGNEGLIHEMIDKSVIVLDYPKIYGKKNCCADCGNEWREY